MQEELRTHLRCAGRVRRNRVASVDDRLDARARGRRNGAGDALVKVDERAGHLRCEGGNTMSYKTWASRNV